ncbi:MAG: hypothetical protein ABIA59_05425, partial [Candidatus Latescibacterota bacterium]
LLEESLQRFADAAEVLMQLTKIVGSDDPRQAESLFRAGKLYKKAGLMEEAVNCFTKLAEDESGRYKEEAEIALASLNSKSGKGFSREQSDTP